MKYPVQFLSIKESVFTHLANRYDSLCDVFSLGLHRRWKRLLVEAVISEPCQQLLDIGSGTGDIAYRVLQHQLSISYNHNQSPNNDSQSPSNDNYSPSNDSYSPSKALKYTVTDINSQMLQLAKIKLSRYSQQVTFLSMDAHQMTDIASNSQDAVTISLTLKICDRQQVMLEALRVLKPQGRLIVLETSIVSHRYLHPLYLVAISTLLPLVGRLATLGDTSCYRYLLEGIKSFPSAEVLAQELMYIGFGEVSFRRLHLGIVAIHIARKPSA